ncbi:MAG: hypothetical protein Q9209_001108 [Squamulea sp. 1 TL-2023]
MAGLIPYLLFSFAAGSARAGATEAAIDRHAALTKHTQVCNEQPQPLPVPVLDFDNVRPASRASRADQFIADSRNLASKASRRASSATRRSNSRRPTIGAPSDFRRVELPSGRTTHFRPLQLSIYLPGNELPTLPTFQEKEGEAHAGLVYPAQALVKSRSDSMLSRPLTSFSIPRKPVPSRTVSMDQTRCSTETRFTFNEMNSALESRPTHRRPSVATRQSTQDFLDALDARLPQSPPASQHKLGPEPVYTLYRRASEQSLRLRTHLEERSRIESHLLECDTILEERHADTCNKSKCLSPIPDRDETTPVDDFLGESMADHVRSDSSPSISSSQFSQRASLSKETALTRPFRRSMVSQWLLRSVGSQASLTSQSGPLPYTTNEDCTGHQQCRFRDRSSTASSTIYSSSTAADLQTTCTTPRSSPRKKDDSISTHHTIPFSRASYGYDKKPMVVETEPLALAF